MARRASDGDQPALCRRPTTDLKEVQDALKLLKQSSSGFLSRHSSFNEGRSRVTEEEAEVSLSPVAVIPPSALVTVEETDGRRAHNPPAPAAMGAGGRRRSRDRVAPIYGEIVVFGTNGALSCQPLSLKMRHKYVLKKQSKATGISQIIRDPGNIDSLNRPSTHTLAMTLRKTHEHVMEFGPDQSYDMFQIGRSADSAIDLVVVDTMIDREGRKVFNSNSTVSRYACRILCEREPPYTARVYAAAFDTNRKIQLSPMATTWTDRLGEHDGITTNGVAIMRPVGTFEPGILKGEWMEVTVMGQMRKMRAQRSSTTPGDPLPWETNILSDGCLIDLCGVTLIWRTALGLDHGPSSTILRERREELNYMSPHCPVSFLTLHFKDGKLVTSNVSDSSREPWVYQCCGHVFSQHEWRASSDRAGNSLRTCPVCRTVGPYVKLELGQEQAFFIDDSQLTHCMTPCGHVTTEETARYWCEVSLPHLASSWTPRCPFCATPLNPTRPSIKLLFS